MSQCLRGASLGSPSHRAPERPYLVYVFAATAEPVGVHGLMPWFHDGMNSLVATSADGLCGGSQDRGQLGRFAKESAMSSPFISRFPFSVLCSPVRGRGPIC